MMMTDKNRRKISAAAFAAVVFLLLLSWNFRVWGGSYTEGDVESIVTQQMERLEKGRADQSAEAASMERGRRLFACIPLSGMGWGLCFPGELFAGLCPGAFEFRASVTLRSLSVRMDN